jgi:hypothetical protein
VTTRLLRAEIAGDELRAAMALAIGPAPLPPPAPGGGSPR